MSSQASLGAGILQTAMRLSISLGLAISTAVFGVVQNNQPADTMLTDPRTTLPYHRALLCASLFAAVGLIFIPFMRINTKDVSPPPSIPPTVIEPALRALDPLDEDHNPEKAAELEAQHNTEFDHSKREVNEYPFHHTPKSSFQSAYTHGSRFSGKSEVSYFPRWSWEVDSGPADHSSSESFHLADFEISDEGSYLQDMQKQVQGKGKKREIEIDKGKGRRSSDRMRYREEEEKVLYEVCVNCLKERRVLVYGGRFARDSGAGEDANPNRRNQIRRTRRDNMGFKEWI